MKHEDSIPLVGITSSTTTLIMLLCALVSRHLFEMSVDFKVIGLLVFLSWIASIVVSFIVVELAGESK
jgi:hypothetical protein